MAALGSLRLRPLLGHRPRGLLRTTATPGAICTHDLARAKAYRWGEDGIAGLCDRYQLLCFAPAFWNERDPHPQGAAVRPRPVRGQSRRGRQGVLLPRRQHADALVHVPALQVPAGGVSVPRADRGEPAPRRPGSGVRAARHRRLRRTTATSTSSSSTPRPIRRTCDPDHGAQPRARRRAAPHPAAPRGSATPGPGARRRSPSR